jgi:hypothetical protein
MPRLSVRPTLAVCLTKGICQLKPVPPPSDSDCCVPAALRPGVRLRASDAVANVAIVIDGWIGTAQLGADCSYAERAPLVSIKLGPVRPVEVHFIGQPEPTKNHE